MGRVGWRPYVSPISTLLTNIYGVWKGDTLGTSLDTSIYGVWNGEANANDSVGTNHGTLMNGTTITAGKIGNAFTYNAATSDYVDLPQMAFKFTGSFTVSMWVYNTSGSGTDRILCHNYPFQPGSGQRGWKFGINTANQIYFIRTHNQFINGSSDLSNALVTVPLNTWTHVGMSWNASTRQLRFIQNGEVVRSVTLSQWDIYYPTPDSLNVARIGHPTFKGKIDAFNIWTKVLTNDEAINLYNSGNGAQYPYSSQTLPSINDSVSNNHGTLTNGATFTTGKIGSSFLFDGVNDYVALPNNSLNLTGDFSISLWYYTNAVNSERYIVSNYIRPAVGSGFIVLQSTTRIGISIYGTGQVNLYTNLNTIAVNTWYHVTVTRKSGTRTRVYLNGVLSASNTSTVDPIYPQPTYPTAIGTAPGYAGFVNGRVDEVNIWTKELTQTEVTQLYNSGTGKQYPF